MDAADVLGDLQQRDVPLRINEPQFAADARPCALIG